MYRSIFLLRYDDATPTKVRLDAFACIKWPENATKDSFLISRQINPNFMNEEVEAGLAVTRRAKFSGIKLSEYLGKGPLVVTTDEKITEETLLTYINNLGDDGLKGFVEKASGAKAKGT